MNVRYITEGGTEMAVLPRAEYERLVEAIEDLEDARTFERVRRDIEEGREELLPEDVVRRLLDEAEPSLRVWREHRGLSQAELARCSGVNRVQIADIEAGRGKGSTTTLKRLADALGVTMDELIPS